MANYLVTGGGGFLGSALSKRLASLGHSVVSLSRGVYPDLTAAGVRTERVDLTTPHTYYSHLFHGIDAVFHVAAKVDMWGPKSAFINANIVATKNVLRCCHEQKVPVLVFTSSPSVIADGTDLKKVDESARYPVHYDAFYPETKAIAEKEVLAAHGNNLRTLSLRPHLIYGPGDTNLIPTILAKAKAGKLVQIGDGTNLSDFTYIDDCVAAHIKAAEALNVNPAVGGRAYFISQGDPVPLWEFVNKVLEMNGLQPISNAINFRFAKALAGIVEAFAIVFRFEPPLTKFLISEMGTSHYFDISAAKRLLNYTPTVSVWEGLEKTRLASFPNKGVLSN